MQKKRIRIVDRLDNLLWRMEHNIPLKRSAEHNSIAAEAVKRIAERQAIELVMSPEEKAAYDKKWAEDAAGWICNPDPVVMDAQELARWIENNRFK